MTTETITATLAAHLNARTAQDRMRWSMMHTHAYSAAQLQEAAERVETTGRAYEDALDGYVDQRISHQTKQPMMEASTIRDCSTLDGKLERMIELRRLLATHPFAPEFQAIVSTYLDAILLAVQGLAVNPEYPGMLLRDTASWPAQHRYLAEAHNWVLGVYQETRQPSASSSDASSAEVNEA